MKRACALVLVLSCAALVPAQNLVPNGSFEEYDICPEYTGYGEYATGWIDLHTNSADYFNACNGNTVVGVPLNQFGYQFAAEGQAYMGMATSSPGGGTWYRELVGIQLTQPLVPGVPICLSFKTAMGGFGSWSGNSTPFSCKGIGLKFFTQFPNDWIEYLYPNSAALSLEFVPTDTAIWYPVFGEYVPDSAYEFIGVGNFYENALLDLTVIDSTGFGGFPVAYAYVDDIRVSFDLTYCTTTTGFVAVEQDELEVYPNPATSMVAVRGLPKGRNTGYHVIDQSGRRLVVGTLNGTDENVIPLNGLDPAAYIIRIDDGAHSYEALRVVVTH